MTLTTTTAPDVRSQAAGWMPQNGSVVGVPQVPGLLPTQQDLLSGLAFKLTAQNLYADVRYAYYDGLQRMQNLGISVPPQLAGVRTVVDWPRICVDPLVQRTVIDGFRLAGATDVDDELAEHWAANNMDAEAPLAFLDAFVTGRGYMIVGSPDVEGDSPLMTVESPSNLSVSWDPRAKRPTAAYQAYQVDGTYRAVLYLPDETISMERTQGSAWSIIDRDVHEFGEVPVIRFPNRARTSDREGRSEITAPVMNATDSACRSLLGMEIAREVYSIPRLAILGADESDFTDASGQPKNAVDMAMTKILALERDENGNTPTLQQLTAFDPSVFTKIIDEHAQLMSSYTGFPPSYFGQSATANPSSADAIGQAENGLVQRAKRAQGQFSDPLREAMKLVWRFANGGAEVPKEIRRMGVDWVPAKTETPAATTDAVVKQIQVGSVPAISDVTLSRLGYSAVERARLAEDRQAAPVAEDVDPLQTFLATMERQQTTAPTTPVAPSGNTGA